MPPPGQPRDSVDAENTADALAVDRADGSDEAEDNSAEGADPGDNAGVDNTAADDGRPGAEPNGSTDLPMHAPGSGSGGGDAPPTLEPRWSGYEPLPTPETSSSEGRPALPFLPAGARPKVNLPRPKVNLPGPRVKRRGASGSGGGGRHRARSGGRVVNERLRHVSPLSVLKISGIFFTCLALVAVVSVVLLWQFARGTGLVDDTESFVTDLFTYGNCVAEDDLELGEDFVDDERCPEGEVLVGGFVIDDRALFMSVLFSGIIFAVAATGGAALLTLLFNLLSDITGGVRYSIVREPVGGGSTGPPSGSTPPVRPSDGESASVPVDAEFGSTGPPEQR